MGPEADFQRMELGTEHGNWSEPGKPNHDDTRDNEHLQRLGKKPVLKRNFGFMSILGFSCSVIITWEASYIVLAQTLGNGGPSGTIYGFIFVWVGSLATFTTLSELTSMAPTAGGQYHWVSMLAPQTSSKFLSYVTGWLTVLGWQSLIASGVFASATLIQGVAVLTVPNYDPTPWQAVLIFFASIFLAVSINVVVNRVLSVFEAVVLLLHLVGFLAALIPIVILGVQNPLDTVFNNVTNDGGWPTSGLGFMIGLLGTAFAFQGSDGAIHLAEEIRDASRVVPYAILMGIMINGVLGFTILIVTLLYVPDLDTAIESPTDFPFMDILRQETGSVAAAATLASLVVVMQLCCDVGLLASTSRMTWSFARDRALPGWQFISKVSRSSFVPVNAVLLTAIISCLLSLINLGSTEAFNNLVSIAIVGLFASYFASAALLLWRRCTGGIGQISETDKHLINTHGARMAWGPWRVPEPWGTLINAYACAYLIIMIFFSLWPTTNNPTPAEMNWSVVVIAVVIGFSIIWYFIQGNKSYKGPLIEVVRPVED